MRPAPDSEPGGSAEDAARVPAGLTQPEAPPVTFDVDSIDAADRTAHSLWLHHAAYVPADTLWLHYAAHVDADFRQPDYAASSDAAADLSATDPVWMHGNADCITDGDPDPVRLHCVPVGHSVCIGYSERHRVLD